MFCAHWLHVSPSLCLQLLLLWDVSGLCGCWGCFGTGSRQGKTMNTGKPSSRMTWTLQSLKGFMFIMWSSIKMCWSWTGPVWFVSVSVSWHVVTQVVGSDPECSSSVWKSFIAVWPQCDSTRCSGGSSSVRQLICDVTGCRGHCGYTHWVSTKCQRWRLCWRFI